jgi:hypothetical protein
MGQISFQKPATANSPTLAVILRQPSDKNGDTENRPE